MAVEERAAGAEASHYWLCTVGPGPTPPPRPWGCLVRQRAPFRWRFRNALAPKPKHRCESLPAPRGRRESGDARTRGRGRGRTRETWTTSIAERSQAKYGWGPVAQYRAEVGVFIPHRAMTWSGLVNNAIGSPSRIRNVARTIRCRRAERGQNQYRTIGPQAQGSTTS